MNICIDACFLIGLYDERDQHHERAVSLFAEWFSRPLQNTAILVWPVLYEAVSTRLARRRVQMNLFERDFRSLRSLNQLDYLDDAEYRDQALDECFAELLKPLSSYRALSLTDRVLRNVLTDTNVNINAVLTFNTGDFIDVCNRSRRLLIT